VNAFLFGREAWYEMCRFFELCVLFIATRNILGADLIVFCCVSLMKMEEIHQFAHLFY
jgi:hypothetical protein